MTTFNDQQEAEQAVFRDFAETAALPVTSIESRLPPEPDILCEINGDGQVAFELGEVVSAALERAVNEHHAVRKQFRSAYAALPPEDRERIETRLGGRPAVFVGFGAGTPPGKWRHAVSPVLAFLVDCAKVDGPEGLCAGDVPTRLLASLTPARITDLTIQRTTANTPFFGIAEPVEVADGTDRMVAKKFRASYNTAAPIELLLYWASAPAPRTTGWREELLANIRAGRPKSAFRRVWCFDLFERVVVIVDPEPASLAGSHCRA
jgi:hypothetical protein